MELIVYHSWENIDVYFEEYNCVVTNSNYQQFLKGTIKCPYEKRTCNIGYLGEGIFTTRIDGRLTKAYKVWASMLNRCYNPSRLKKYPTYTNLTVEDYFHNFQNFGYWHEENYYEIEGQKMHLDKDILSRAYGFDNKIYSRETCVYVPERINYLFTKADKSRGDLPIGVTWNRQQEKYHVCSINNEYLGRYDNPIEAFNIYKIYKEKYIKQIADEYKNLIPLKLYEAMYKYEVRIDD